METKVSKINTTETIFDLSCDDIDQSCASIEGCAIRNRSHSVVLEELASRRFRRKRNASTVDNIGGWAQGFDKDVNFDPLAQLEDCKRARINLKVWYLCYFLAIVGSVFFIIGSTYFLPGREDRINEAVVLFTLGVINFIICQVFSTYNLRIRHDGCFSVPFYLDMTAEIAIHIGYFTGYGPGSILFFNFLPPECIRWGAIFFIWGSVIICFGFALQMSVLSYLSFEANEPFRNRILDLFGFINFIMGALVWGISSVNYLLGDVPSQVFAFSGGLYILGGVFFFFGAFFVTCALTCRWLDNEKKYKRLKKYV